MTKWSTSWTSYNVVSTGKHAETVRQARPFSFVPIADAARQTTPEAAFVSLVNPKPEPKIIYRGFSEEDVKKAREEGFQEGYGKGHEEGLLNGKKERFEVDRSISTSLSMLDQKLELLYQSFSAHLHKSTEDVEKLALMIAKKVAGKALDEKGEANIRHLVGECIGFILHEPEVTITVHRSMIQSLNDYLSQQLKIQGAEGKIHIQGSNDMPETDCTIEWKEGGAQLSIQDRWQQIYHVLGEEIRLPPAAGNAVQDNLSESVT